MFEPDFLTAEDLSGGCGDKIDVVVVSKHFEGMQPRANFMEGYTMCHAQYIFRCHPQE